jgi:hypothetical protein
MSPVEEHQHQQQQQQKHVQLNPEPNQIFIINRTQYEQNGLEA